MEHLLPEDTGKVSDARLSRAAAEKILAAYEKKHTRAVHCLMRLYEVRRQYIVSLIMMKQKRWRIFKKYVGFMEQCLKAYNYKVFVDIQSNRDLLKQSFDQQKKLLDSALAHNYHNWHDIPVEIQKKIWKKLD